MCSLRVLPNTGTTRQPPFYINSASIGIVKSNQQSILNYHSVFRPLLQQSTVISQQSRTVQPELILLTGMGEDGAKGMSLLRSRGWHTIAQDEKSSVVYGMPKAAVQLNAAVEVLPQSAIDDRLVQRVLFK